MGIPMGGRRYHSKARAHHAAERRFGTGPLILIHGDSRPLCPHCGSRFQPAEDGQHYVIGKIPCTWRAGV